MPTIVPTINLGEVFTLLVTACAFLVGIGKFTQKITDIVMELSQLRADFHAHASDDQEGFRQVNEALLKLALGKDRPQL